MELSSEDAEYYQAQSVVTDPGDAGRAMLSELPADPGVLARIVRGLLIHRLEEERFGVRLDAQRLHRDAETRYVEDILRLIRERSDAPLSERREPVDRFVGVCRDFVVLHVALLRQAGVPARARVGTSTYFSPQHWLTEYWAPGRGWVLIDPQLAFGAGEAGYGFSFDPYDVTWPTFSSGGMGWRQARLSPPASPNWHILIGDVQLDLAALNKVELLPWDVWGAMELGENEEPDARTLALVDEVASATGPDGSLADLRRLITANDQLLVPPTVTSCTTYLGNRRVTLHRDAP